MKSLLLLSLVSFFATAYPGPRNFTDAEEPVRQTLRLEVDNVKAAKGKIWVGIYQSEADFLDREKARLVYVDVSTTGHTFVDIPDLVVGQKYALGIFHDVNDNGEFDTNWLGLPAEPWAFSGEPKTRLRLPRFEEVSFWFADGAKHRLRLRKW
ncbi:MAG: DUF2141 domain-containing protein [Bacteroidota bacterium]